MPKALVIAEKPSVAQDIARALGNAKRTGQHFESEDYVITSAIGHLLEMDDEAAKPKAKKAKKAAKGKAAKATKTATARKPGKWSLASLPAIPNRFALKPTKDGKERIGQIKKLEKRDDVGVVVNACDAGREGELIFHNIQSYLKIDKPVKRLWLQSMTPAAIRKGFDELRSSKEFAALCDAAVARSQADWLVGINATRAFTALNSKDGGFVLTPAGRVQTPTLALLVKREKERKAHVPEKYWNIKADFEVADGTYEGKWVRGENGKGDDKAKSPRDRLFDQQRQKTIMALLEKDGVAGDASDKSKDKVMRPPALFDLNTLQREANRAHSFSARATLRAAQALYEKHKLLTYPRTETRFLPVDYVDVCAKTLHKLADIAPHAPLSQPDSPPNSKEMRELEQNAQKATAADTEEMLEESESNRSAGLNKETIWQAIEGVNKVGKKVFDDSKLTDHFAIIPTGLVPSAKLTGIERKVYNMVCRRFVAAFMPNALVRETVRTTKVEDEVFETKGQIIIKEGWLVATGHKSQNKVLPSLADETEKAKVLKAESEQKETRPPARYDDATLLGAMQGAYRFIKDEDDLAEALKEGGGLGTPATRAEIIEELIRNGYVSRGQGELVPSARAFSLLELCSGMGIDELAEPRLTGDWESRLKRIEQGSGDRDEFLEGIRGMVRQIADVAKGFDPDSVEGDYVTLEGKCPKCGGTMAEGARKYVCQNNNCQFFFWKVTAGRQTTPDEAEQLLDKGVIGPFEDFMSKFAKPFEASLLLDKETGKLNFEFPGQAEEDIDPAEMESMEAVGSCPKKECGGKVLDTGTSYACEKLLNGSKECDFRLGKVICKRDLAPDEVSVLFDNGKSNLLSGFTSKRGKPFGAYLLLDETGKLGFEFQPRASKASGKKQEEATQQA